MKKLTQILTAVAFTLSMVAAANAQSANLITGNSAGKVKLGMTVAQVRKAVAPMKLSRTSDGEGVALIAVKKSGTTVMVLYAEGEEDPAAKLNEKARIEQIDVWDRSYRTKEGVHSGMLLSDVEKKYGKVNNIYMSQIESREYAELADQPDGIDFRLIGKNGSAGAYAPNEHEASAYTNGTIIYRIEVRQPRGFSDGLVKFSSSYTDLKTGCKSIGGNEGSHASTFCKGPAGYQIHAFDSATTLEFNAENEKEEFQVRLASEALDYASRNSKIEWRLANGKPFAVIMRVFAYPVGGEFPKQGKPTGSFLVVKGLKGFESIDGRVDGKEMYPNLQARELADAAFKPGSPSSPAQSSDVMDVKTFNNELAAAFQKKEDWARSPGQIVARFLPVFDETKTRKVEYVSKNPESGDSISVVAIDDGYMDDSVRGEKYQIELTKTATGKWTVKSAKKTVRCWPGRGHQDFSSKPCI